MRFSYQGNRSVKNTGVTPRERGGGGPQRTRKCLGCNREMDDDGSVLFIRGFCSQKCLSNYLNSDGVGEERKEDGAYL